MSDPAIKVNDVHKSYRMGRVNLHVLRGATFSVQPGEFVAIVGASGSGKSTLLHLAGLLDRPDKGAVNIRGIQTDNVSGQSRNALRCTQMGFVFQFYHLLGELNVMENVLLPAMVDCSVTGWVRKRREMRRRAEKLLDQMGLGDRLKHRPKELSGGERQRVAIARAMINQPQVLFADEPTGNLDSHTGEQIMKVFREFHQKQRQTILMVTHDPSVAEQADRVLHLRDGVL